MFVSTVVLGVPAYMCGKRCHQLHVQSEQLPEGSPERQELEFRAFKYLCATLFMVFIIILI